MDGSNGDANEFSGPLSKKPHTLGMIARNEEKILVAAMANFDRPEMLQKVLIELCSLLKDESCKLVGQVFHIVLESMNRHLMDSRIQVTSTATLSFIIKGTSEEHQDVVKNKKRIITTILNSMSAHINEDSMLKNGCLTLCEFKIPIDVCDFERLYEILLHALYRMPHERQYNICCLLQLMASQADSNYKIKLGELGIINTMLWLITDRLQRIFYDNVLVIAWSILSSVTDETPVNSKNFLENQGLECFFKCIEKFRDKDELLQSMTIFLGNVAEVKSLRYCLMRPEYISVLSDLLNTGSGFNIAEVISHIASDGPEAWIIEEPTRECVLDRMMCTINQWDLETPRNMVYKSLRPILNLVSVFETPECQIWAVWALVNLTKVNPNKYCNLVVSEGGIALLEDIIEQHLSSIIVKELASRVIDSCRVYKEQS